MFAVPTVIGQRLSGAEALGTEKIVQIFSSFEQMYFLCIHLLSDSQSYYLQSIYIYIYIYILGFQNFTLVLITYMPSSFVCALFILVSSVQCDHNHLSDYCLATVGLHCATKMIKNKATTILVQNHTHTK